MIIDVVSINSTSEEVLWRQEALRRKNGLGVSINSTSEEVLWREKMGGMAKSQVSINSTSEEVLWRECKYCQHGYLGFH